MLDFFVINFCGFGRMFEVDIRVNFFMCIVSFFGGKVLLIINIGRIFVCSLIRKCDLVVINCYMVCDDYFCFVIVLNFLCNQVYYLFIVDDFCYIEKMKGDGVGDYLRNEVYNMKEEDMKVRFLDEVIYSCLLLDYLI